MLYLHIDDQQSLMVNNLQTSKTKKGRKRKKKMKILFDANFHHFSVALWWINLPDIAAASAAVKAGSFVKEEAIFSTKNC